MVNNIECRIPIIVLIGCCYTKLLPFFMHMLRTYGKAIPTVQLHPVTQNAILFRNICIYIQSSCTPVISSLLSLNYIYRVY